MIEGAKIPKKFEKTKKGVERDFIKVLCLTHLLFGADIIIDVIEIRR